MFFSPNGSSLPLLELSSGARITVHGVQFNDPEMPGIHNPNQDLHLIIEGDSEAVQKAQQAVNDLLNQTETTQQDATQLDASQPQSYVSQTQPFGNQPQYEQYVPQPTEPIVASQPYEYNTSVDQPEMKFLVYKTQLLSDGSESAEIRVPNDKVGLVIGKSKSTLNATIV